MVPSRLTTSILLPSCSIPFIDPGGSSEREHTLTRVATRLTTGTCSASRTDRRRHLPSPALPRGLEAFQGLIDFVRPFHAASLLAGTVSRLSLTRAVFVGQQ